MGLFVFSSYDYWFTCWPALLLVLNVDLPDTTSLLCSQPAAAAALFGSGLKVHQLQHR